MDACQQWYSEIRLFVAQSLFGFLFVCVQSKKSNKSVPFFWSTCWTLQANQTKQFDPDRRRLWHNQSGNHTHKFHFQSIDSIDTWKKSEQNLSLLAFTSPISMSRQSNEPCSSLHRSNGSAYRYTCNYNGCDIIQATNRIMQPWALDSNGVKYEYWTPKSIITYLYVFLSIDPGHFCHQRNEESSSCPQPGGLSISQLVDASRGLWTRRGRRSYG